MYTTLSPSPRQQREQPQQQQEMPTMMAIRTATEPPMMAQPVPDIVHSPVHTPLSGQVPPLASQPYIGCMAHEQITQPCWFGERPPDGQICATAALASTERTTSRERREWTVEARILLWWIWGGIRRTEKMKRQKIEYTRGANLSRCSLRQMAAGRMQRAQSAIVHVLCAALGKNFAESRWKINRAGARLPQA